MPKAGKRKAEPKPSPGARTPAAFVSYTKFDDEHESGWIKGFCTRLEKSVQAQGVEGFGVFQFLDGKSIKWGHDWRRRIDDALDSSTFFIPVMTPKFLQSDGCLEEAERFLAREDQTKRPGFVLPILLRGCTSSPCKQSGQQMRERLFSFQWSDWQELKYSEFDTAKVRKAMDLLAERIQGELAKSPAAPGRPALGVTERKVATGKRTRLRAPHVAGSTGPAVGVARAAGATAPGPGVVPKIEQGQGEIQWQKDGAVMVRIPAGPFKMGSREYPDERPVHDVHLDEYLIDKYPVTNQQYLKFCDETGRPYPSDPGFPGMTDYLRHYPEHPVVHVSWDDAKAYCDRAGKRLPTEAEWEKASRGTDERRYPWGNEEPDGTQCNFADKNTDYSWSDKRVNDGYTFASPVNAFPRGASPYGVLDMAGNVWEWCNDWYGEKYYEKSPPNNPKGPDSGSTRVLRGGSWYVNPAILRCANRFRFGPSYRDLRVGFRCAVTV